MNFKEIVEQRYATKLFDGKQIPEEKVTELLHLIKMSASSFGLQPFKVMIVTDEQTKKELEPHAFNQPQITSCSHLLVICAYTDVEDRIQSHEKMLGPTADKYMAGIKHYFMDKTEEQIFQWAKGQTYIAMANAINGAKALGFDSCPIEGFNPEGFAKVLNTPKNLKPAVLVPIGFANDTPRKKVRYSDDELFIKYER